MTTATAAAAAAAAAAAELEFKSIKGGDFRATVPGTNVTYRVRRKGEDYLVMIQNGEGAEWEQIAVGADRENGEAFANDHHNGVPLDDDTTHNPMPADVQRVLDQVQDGEIRECAKEAAAVYLDVNRPDLAVYAAAASASHDTPKKSKVEFRLLPPVALDWKVNEDGDLMTAVNSRWAYRVYEGQTGGWFAGQRLAKGGSWTPLAGRCETIEQAKHLAEATNAIGDHDRHWLGWSKFAGLPYGQVIDLYGTTAN